MVIVYHAIFQENWKISSKKSQFKIEIKSPETVASNIIFVECYHVPFHLYCHCLKFVILTLTWIS